MADFLNEGHAVSELPCLGSTVAFVRSRGEGEEEWRDVAATVIDESSYGIATSRLQAFGAALAKLHASGLEKQLCFTLLRSYASGAATHLQQARLTR